VQGAGAVAARPCNATRPILWSLIPCALGTLARFGCKLLNSCYFTPTLHQKQSQRV